MCKITFQYYKANSKVYDYPKEVSAQLYGLIMDAVREIGASKCHIVHVGIRPDSKHKKTSYHKKVNSKAIDVAKLYLEWENGRKIVLVPRDSRSDRHLIAKHWGGRALHLGDMSKYHVHLDTKGAE